jgi:hypothetical protein
VGYFNWITTAEEEDGEIIYYVSVPLFPGPHWSCFRYVNVRSGDLIYEVHSESFSYHKEVLEGTEIWHAYTSFFIQKHRVSLPCLFCGSVPFGSKGLFSLLVEVAFELCKIWGFTAVTVKNGIFWDVTPCGSCKNRHFEGT